MANRENDGWVGYRASHHNQRWDDHRSRGHRRHRRGGWTLVKVSKPDQDMRFDVPTIGPQTIQRVHEAGGAAIAIEAGKTILLDSEETIQLADRLGIALVAMASADTMEDQLSSSRKAA